LIYLTQVKSLLFFLFNKICFYISYTTLFNAYFGVKIGTQNLHLSGFPVNLTIDIVRIYSNLRVEIIVIYLLIKFNIKIEDSRNN